MNKLFLLLLFLTSSCAPQISWHENQMVIATTINNNTLSCYKGTCCVPYRHHKDVKDIRIMLCSQQVPDKSGWHQMNVSIKGYFR